MGSAPASASEAMEMVHAGCGYLAAADATAMAAGTQARCLQMLEQAHSMGTAARSSILAAFTSGQGYAADADYSPRAWLIHKTRITGAAVAHTAWARRAAAHPLVAAVLAAGEISESSPGRSAAGRTAPRIAGRPRHDPGRRSQFRIDLRDLAASPARSTPVPRTPPDDGPDDGFGTALKLETTFAGAGVLTGDLTPECGSIVATVLDALSAPAGAR